MAINSCTCLTDYEWQDDIRPEIRIYPGKNAEFHALLSFGSDTFKGWTMEWHGQPDDLAEQLAGIAELFAHAADHVRGIKGQP